MAERIRTLARPRELPREVHDRAVEMFSAACAEAGHPVRYWWDDDRHEHVVQPVTILPPDVCHKAGRLMHDALGLPYEVVSEAS